MPENLYQEVRFDKYCKTCKHTDVEEKCDPCCECLDEGCNVESEHPVNWKEKSE